MNAPHTTGQEQRTKRNAARDLRSYNEAKQEERSIASRSRCNPRAASVASVPPYCYMQPGISIEHGATEAVRALRISSAADAIGLLWQMRRVADQSVASTSGTS